MEGRKEVFFLLPFCQIRSLINLYHYRSLAICAEATARNDLQMRFLSLFPYLLDIICGCGRWGSIHLKAPRARRGPTKIG